MEDAFSECHDSRQEQILQCSDRRNLHIIFGLMASPIQQVLKIAVDLLLQATQNMEIEVHGKGGHTMVPPHDGSSVVARMGRLVNKIETSFPAPKLQAPTSDLLKTVGSATPKKLLGLLLRNCEKW